MKKFFLVPVLLMMSACSFSTNDLTKYLDIAQISVNTLVGLLGVAGKIPPAEQTVIAGWAATAADAISYAATEVTSKDTTADKIKNITDKFAPILTSLDPAAQPYVLLAQQDLAVFLKLLNPDGGVANPDGSFSAHGVTVKAHIDLPLLKGKFKEIKVKADADAAKARAFRGEMGGPNGQVCPPNTGCR